MSEPIASFQWTFGTGSSTGAHPTVFDNVGLRMCLNQTFCLNVDGATTCSIGIEAGIDSTSGFARMGSTRYELAAGETQVVQFSGPQMCLRPYLIARTNSNALVRVILTGA